MQQTYEQISERPMPLGALADLGERDVISAINSSPGAAQVDTVTITNYVAGKQLTWTIDGVAFSYTMTIADADTTGVATSIKNQLQRDPLFGGRFYATSALGVVTLTARYAGVGWTIVSTGTWIADFTVAHTTANATGASLQYGLLVVDDGQVTGRQDKKGKIGSAANLSAKVISLTPVAVNSTVYTVSIKVKGYTYTATITSDGTATVKEIVEAIEPILTAQLPAQTVAVTEDDTKLTFTAEIAGLDFDVECGSGGATALWTVTETTVGRATSVSQAAIGIALRSDSIETNSDTAPGYPANRAMSVLRRGRICVPVDAQPTSSSRVYVRLADTGATGYTVGGFSTAAGTDKVELDPAKFRWVRGLSSTKGILQVACD